MKNHPDTIINLNIFQNSYLNVPQPVNISVDDFYVSNTMPNIFIQLESTIINQCVEHYIIHNYSLYRTIFAFNKNILEKCPNAIFYIYGTTWIEKNIYENIDITKKQYKISTLAGTKIVNNAPGHLYRQLVHHNQLLQYPITYFRSITQLPHIYDYGNNPFIDCKYKLFEEFQFAIIIENSRQINYFTEKIMDCILTKTIPIYWGCPNISDFFDITGWIILESDTLEELEKLDVLNDTYYNKYMDVIEKNYIEALQYTDLSKNINNAIELNRKTHISSVTLLNPK